MQSVLNFSEREKKELKQFLKVFRELEPKSPFEEARAEANGCVLTLYKSGKLLIQGKNAEKIKEKILEGMKGKNELVLGIDETGRGENFGPFVVAGVLGETKKLRELRDSKKTKNIVEKAGIAEKNLLGKKIVLFTAKEIDFLRNSGKNMNEIEAEAINKITMFFRKKYAEKKFRVVVDGAPIKGVKHAEFVPKADDKIVQVSAASLLAKNARNNSSDRSERKTWKKRN